MINGDVDDDQELCKCGGRCVTCIESEARKEQLRIKREMHQEWIKQKHSAWKLRGGDSFDVYGYFLTKFYDTATPGMFQAKEIIADAVRDFVPEEDMVVRGQAYLTLKDQLKKANKGISNHKSFLIKEMHAFYDWRINHPSELYDTCNMDKEIKFIIQYCRQVFDLKNKMQKCRQSAFQQLYGGKKKRFPDYIRQDSAPRYSSAPSTSLAADPQSPRSVSPQFSVMSELPPAFETCRRSEPASASVSRPDSHTPAFIQTSTDSLKDHGNFNQWLQTIPEAKKPRIQKATSANQIETSSTPSTSRLTSIDKLPLIEESIPGGSFTGANLHRSERNWNYPQYGLFTYPEVAEGLRPALGGTPIIQSIVNYNINVGTSALPLIPPHLTAPLTVPPGLIDNIHAIERSPSVD